MTATRIDDEISVEEFGMIPLTPLAYLDADDTGRVRRGEQSGNLGIGDDMDLGPLRDAIPHMPLQQRTAEADSLWPFWQRQQAFGRNDGERNLVGGSSSPIRTQVAQNAGEE